MSKIYANPAYAPRLDTDKYFMTPFAAEWSGEALKAVDTVQQKQLMNTELWTLFVKQFIDRPDAPDRGWRGEYWGKMMRAACFTWRVTHDEALYAALRQTVEAMMNTADADGRISSYPREAEFQGWDMWSRKYILLGFEYFWDICADEAFKARIIEAACRHLDCVIANIGEGKKSIFETSHFWGCINSCSILEPVMKLYFITKKPEYLNFAEYIVSHGGCKDGNVIELAIENKLPPYQFPVVKAYETMSFFEGVGEYYRLTHDEKYKTAIVNFANAVLATDYTIIGNCGCTHELFDNSTLKQTEPGDIAQETCVAVTLSKFLYQVYCLTGDYKYMDAIERTYYNSILGSINFAGNTELRYDRPTEEKMNYEPTRAFVRHIGGFMFDSYSPLYKARRNRATGGYKEMEGDKAYGCCACIGGAGVALLPMTAIMLSKTGIVINHYLNGKFNVETLDGEKLTIDIKTGYPYAGKVEITVNRETDTPLTMEYRVPGKGYECAKITDKTYAMTLEFDVSARVTELNGKIAVTKGCIVYAADCRNADINAVVTDKIVSEAAVDKDFECRNALNVEFSNGTRVKLTDYASAGANWDEENCYVTAWLDK